ncbi:MAG: TraR/DksA C4-type zinc finger protein, partial [Planctomycetota bacterium]|nr:TraR/DksA C4-type zinc finger protein [Planctomycetota bacterium]
DLLLSKRRELSNNISSEMKEMRDADNSDLSVSDVDDVGASQDNETTFKILELESDNLGQIDDALERIEAGTYGICEECKEPVGIERLKALPFTPLCISCKRLQESSYDYNSY